MHLLKKPWITVKENKDQKSESATTLYISAEILRIATCFLHPVMPTKTYKIINALDNCPENYNPNQENSNNEALGDACLCELLTLVPINENFNGFTIGETESFYISTIEGDYVNNLVPSFNINEPYNSDNEITNMFKFSE